jgi:flagellar biosynthesis protein FlhG
MTDVVNDKPARRAMTIAVTSGKGGVGKTSVALNLAAALARLDHRVGVIDADFGLANVDVALGLHPDRHLGHLLRGEATLDQVLPQGPLGLQILPAASGLRELTTLTSAEWERLAHALDALTRRLFDPSAVVDAYAMIKLLTAVNPQQEIGVLVNGVSDGDGRVIFDQLRVAADRFLQRRLAYYGFIPQDRAVRDSVLSQTTVVEQTPQAPASRSFRALASRLSGLGSRGGPGLRLIAARRTGTGAGTEMPLWA